MKQEALSIENVKTKEEDRFKELTENYGNLFIEVFKEMGLDYEKLEKSVLEAVAEANPDFKSKKILDIGCGDGSTLKPFVEAGCTDLTGLDLNRDMLKQAEKNFNDKVKLVQADANKMPFQSGEFPIIITAQAIHNIPKVERKKFWQEILRMNPEIFIDADKMVADTEEEQKQSYDRELAAIKKVFLDKHGLEKEYQTWVEHYKYDERERLYVSEIEEMLGSKYDIKVTKSNGMQKTVIAVKRK